MFAGLEGLATNLLAREPSQKKFKETHGATGRLSQGGLGQTDHLGWSNDASRGVSQLMEYMSSDRQMSSPERIAISMSRKKLAKEVIMQQDPGSIAPLGKLALLKQMTIHSASYSVVHDLSTPHRNFIFGESRAEVASKQNTR